LEIVNSKCKKDKFMVLVMTEGKNANNELYLFSIYKNVKNNKNGRNEVSPCPCVWTNIKGT